jgi:hypothetical protein
VVGGKCYCDSNDYDHNLDTKTVQTPQGRKGVAEVCEAITRVLGAGATSGRVPYNDIECGNQLDTGKVSSFDSIELNAASSN